MIHESIDVVPAVARILAMALTSMAVAAVAAFVYRWYSGHSIPEGVAMLLGASVVAIWLNTTATLRSSIAAGELVGEGAAVFTLVAFAASTLGADLGRRAGEHLSAGLPSVQDVRTIEDDVGQLVRARGRVIRVTVPDNVADIDGYEPVPEAVKADLAGTTFLFPRGLTVAALRERFVERLERDHDVGHVDVELAPDGTVEYLALGRRLAGIGTTLAPGTVAVAIRADPAFSATPGDRVQVWRSGTPGDPDPAGSAAAEPEHVVTGELRAAVADVATVVVDEADAGALRDDEPYRLVTLPSEAQPDREFASLLRSAAETMAAVEVGAGSDLDGAAVSSIELTVAALDHDGDVEAIPRSDRTLAAGDTVYAVGRLGAIRRLEARGAGSVGTADGTEPVTAKPQAED